MNRIIKKAFPENIKAPLRKIRGVYRGTLAAYKKYAVPKFLIHFVTTRCQLNCKHCFCPSESDASSKDKLSLSELKKVILSFNAPIDTVVLTGGEPFLHKDLVEMALLYNSLNKARIISINTNGYATDTIVNSVNKILNDLDNNSCLSLQVSLDGPERIHNDIRGNPYSFQNAAETIRRLKKIQVANDKMHIHTLCIINQKNCNYLKELSSYCMENLNMPIYFELVRRNICDFHSVEYKPRDGLTGDLSFDLKRAFNDIVHIYNQQDKRFKSKSCSSMIGKIRDEFTIAREGKRLFACMAGNYAGALFSNGDVSPCELLDFRLNLRDFDYNFPKIWNSPRMRAVVEKIRRSCFCTLGCFVGLSRQRIDYQLKTLFAKPKFL
ncbi:MAG: radical SAM protein [Candidatus Omnitrophota bacterium]|jgi:MoaA/NifB/PqqE/SkfB family radical SAM enzyme